MLPYSNVAGKPPIAAMLDTCLIYLRHNLSKKLDVECYMYVLARILSMNETADLHFA